MIKKTALSTLLLCTSGLVIAEDVPPNQTEAVTKLESMQVRAEPDSGYAVSNSSSATRTDTPIKQIPQSIQVLPHQLIDDQQNVTVSEALKNVSGVVANDELATPAFETTRIRGFKAEHLVDGFSQYYNTGDRESLVNVEKIEVLKGANSILHSGGAGSPVGGVINVTSKLPQAKAFGELGIKFGTNSFFQPFFDINQPLSPNALFRVTGEFTTSGSDIALLDQNRYNVNPTLTLTDGKDTTLTLQGKLSHWAQQEYQGLPAVGTVAGNFRIKRDLFIGENNIPDTTADFKGIWATLDHKINDMWSFNVKARYAESQFDEQTQLIFSNAPDMPPSTWAFGNTQMQQTQKEHSFMANAKAKFDWGMTKNTVLFGVDYTEIRDTGVMNSDAFLAFNLIDLANPVFSVPYIAPPTSP
ncbi:MAG: TonB-dependent receptor plug domain-containing protein, partial [Methylococcales bacterium]